VNLGEEREMNGMKENETKRGGKRSEEMKRGEGLKTNC